MTVQDFETRPASEFKPSRNQPGLVNQKFKTLEAGTAMFVPLNGQKNLLVLRSSLFSGLRHLHDGKVRTSIDEAKNGVWIWWEAKA